LELLAEAAAAQGFSTEVREDQNGVAPFLPLPGSYEEYLERLPSKLRHEIKRKARRLEGKVGPWHICLATQDTLEAFLDRFVELHRPSEGPKGVFVPPGLDVFFRALGEEFLPALKLTLSEAMAVVLSARLMVRYADKYDPDLAAAGDRTSVEQSYLTWLGSALIAARDARRRGVGDIQLGTPAGVVFTFDGAIADFSEAYADVNDRDYAEFLAALPRGCAVVIASL